MKRIYQILIPALFLSVFATSCYNPEPTYDSISVAPAPTVTISVTDVKDSSFVLNLTSDKAGYVSFVVFDDTSEVVTDNMLLLKQNVTGFSFSGLEKVTDGGTATWNISPIMPNKQYKIYAVSGNTDGVPSEIQSQVVLTSDGVSPTLLGYSPAGGSDGVSADFSITLQYDENVKYDNTKSFALTYYYEGVTQTIPADHVSVSGKKVTVTQNHTPVPGELVMLNMPGGAVTDIVGNPADTITTAVVDGAIEGSAYWFVELQPVEMASITPTNGSSVTDANFAITIKYPSDMDLTGDASPVMTYYDGFGVYTFEVPDAYIDASPADSTVTIYKPDVPDKGVWVSLSLPEGVFADSKGNPSAAVESKADGTGKAGLYWLVSYGYTRDMVLGDYTISGTSYWAGYDETFDVTIIADPNNANQILIQGLLGSTNDVVGLFDGDFATITIFSNQSLGNVDAANPNDVYYVDGWNGDIPIFVNPDGSFVFNDWWYIYYDSAADGGSYYYNLFTSSSATKTVAAVLTTQSMLKSASISSKKIPLKSVKR